MDFARLLAMVLPLVLFALPVVPASPAIHKVSTFDLDAPVGKHIVSQTVTFVTIPAIGHLNPMIALAEEMGQRGWQCIIVSFDSIERHVELAKVQGSVSYVSLPCGAHWNASRAKMLHFIAENPSFWDSVQFGLRSLVEDEVWDCFYEHGFKTLQAKRPDLMVIDASTFVGLDIASRLGVPYVINNPALIDIHDSPHCMPPAIYLPGTLSGQSIHAEISGLSRLLKRAGHPFLQLAQNAYLYFALHLPLNAKRRRLGFAAKPYQICEGDRLILVEQVLGVEYPRPVPPLMHFVGYLERRDEPELQLKPAEMDWLSGEASPLPVVYVSFGTVFNLNLRQAKVLLDGLTSSNFRALWSLKTWSPDTFAVPSNVHITPWVSSQLGVLAHPNVRVFISHCGDNSLYESVRMGTPLLCIPVAFDQLDCATRALDAGIAGVLDKDTFTSEDIQSEIAHILKFQGRFQENLARARALMRLAGGVARAADLVEHVHQHGTPHLSPLVSQQSILQAMNADAWLTYAIIQVAVALILWCFLKCLSRGLRRFAIVLKPKID